MKAAIAILASAALAAAADARAEVCAVAPETWDKPRSGRALLGQEALKPCVMAFLAAPGTRLLIRHGLRGEAPLQAEELRSWLAALALDPARIVLAPDPGRGDGLAVETVSP